MSSMINKEKLARLAQALDDRADNKVLKEAERAAQVEADLQAHSDETREMLGGKTLKYLTQAEYDLLSDEEKNNNQVIYYITDLEDNMHDHYNKNILDVLDDDFIENIGKGQMVEIEVPVDMGWYRIASIVDNNMCILKIKEAGEGVYSDSLILVGASKGSEPRLLQLGMDAMSVYRQKQIRVVYNPAAEDLEAYVELNLDYNAEVTEMQIQVVGDAHINLVEAINGVSEIDEEVYSVKEMNLLPGRIIGEFGGSIEYAEKLAVPRNINIGQCSREFDASMDIYFSLNDIGAAPRSSENLNTENKIVVDAINELDDGLNAVEAALGGYKIWVGTTEQFNAIAEKDPMTLYFEINNSSTMVDMTVGDVGGMTTGFMSLENTDEHIPAYSPEEEVVEDVILTSPSGFKFKLTVDDYGNLTTEHIE